MRSFRKPVFVVVFAILLSVVLHFGIVLRRLSDDRDVVEKLVERGREPHFTCVQKDLFGSWFLSKLGIQNTKYVSRILLSSNLFGDADVQYLCKLNYVSRIDLRQTAITTDGLIDLELGCQARIVVINGIKSNFEPREFDTLDDIFRANKGEGGKQTKGKGVLTLKPTGANDTNEAND